jgi:hypothetical protein
MQREEQLEELLTEYQWANRLVSNSGQCWEPRWEHAESPGIVNGTSMGEPPVSDAGQCWGRRWEHQE